MHKSISNRQYIFALTTITIILLTIYSNSFKSSWHFDDYRNIVNNPNIKINNLTVQEVRQAFNIYRNNDSRPLVFLTFAINYYFGKDNVFGYHAVNFALHWLTSIVLFFFIVQLLNLPKIQEEYQKKAYHIALISTILWLSSPLQVSAVTYIVQRMTIMSGLFYLLAMLSYIRARTTPSRHVWFYFLTLICSVLALASKQNSAMLPISILLLEGILISGAERFFKDYKMIIRTVIILLCFSAIILSSVDISSIFTAGYDKRPFTLLERLLTQPRVILFYLSLLLYPTSERLTFLHDFELSSSLITPWQTLPAIGITIFLNALALINTKRFPLLSFCILFYFANHLIEGSILSLELIFEHRNYLPSMLIFVPVSVAIIAVTEYFKTNLFLQYLLATCVAFLIFAQSHTTYKRNYIFRNEIALWTDNVAKSPGLMRPYQNLGNAMFTKGALEQGLAVTMKGLNKRSANSLQTKYQIYYSLGNYYFLLEDFEKAWSYYVKSLRVSSLFSSAHTGLAMTALRTGNLERAEKLSRKALTHPRADASDRHALAVILLHNEKYDEALNLAKKTLRENKQFTQALYTVGEALRMKGEFTMSLEYYRQFLERSPEKIDALFAIIEIKAQQNDLKAVYEYKQQLKKELKGRKLSEVLPTWGNKIYRISAGRMESISNIY